MAKIDSITSHEDRKDSRKQKQVTSTKSGGGTQGREIKNKKVKNKYRGRGHAQEEGSDEEGAGAGGSGAFEVEFLTEEEIGEKLREFEAMQECDEELLDFIAKHLHRHDSHIGFLCCDAVLH